MMPDTDNSREKAEWPIKLIYLFMRTMAYVFLLFTLVAPIGIVFDHLSTQTVIVQMLISFAVALCLSLSAKFMRQRKRFGFLSAALANAGVSVLMISAAMRNGLTWHGPALLIACVTAAILAGASAAALYLAKLAAKL